MPAAPARVIPPAPALFSALLSARGCSRLLAPALILLLALPSPAPAQEATPDPTPNSARIQGDDQPLVREKLPPRSRTRPEPPATGKFLNKDTAKNRKDTGLGTRETKGTLSIDDDEDARTMNAIPAKRKKQEEQIPVTVQPIIRAKP
jgi:hypothetical protein